MRKRDDGYISLTDMANAVPDKSNSIIEWRSSKVTQEFLDQWHSSHVGIDGVSETLDGTYAHRDIAIEFGAFLSPNFKLYLIQEYQRLRKNVDKDLGAHFRQTTPEPFNEPLSDFNQKLFTALNFNPKDK